MKLPIIICLLLGYSSLYLKRTRFTGPNDPNPNSITVTKENGEEKKESESNINYPIVINDFEPKEKEKTSEQQGNKSLLKNVNNKESDSTLSGLSLLFGSNYSIKNKPLSGKKQFPAIQFPIPKKQLSFPLIHPRQDFSVVFDWNGIYQNAKPPYKLTLHGSWGETQTNYVEQFCKTNINSVNNPLRFDSDENKKMCLKNIKYFNEQKNKEKMMFSRKKKDELIKEWPSYIYTKTEDFWEHELNEHGKRK